MIPEAAVNIIRTFEGLRLQAYLDSVGVPTIGYGSTRGIKLGMHITENLAENYLIRDISFIIPSVMRLITLPLNENQLSAILSFTYNLGSGCLQHSTLRSMLNRGETSQIPAQMLRYCYAGGRKLPGLMHRRFLEGKLFSL